MKNRASAFSDQLQSISYIKEMIELAIAALSTETLEKVWKILIF